MRYGGFDPQAFNEAVLPLIEALPATIQT